MVFGRSAIWVVLPISLGIPFAVCWLVGRQLQAPPASSGQSDQLDPPPTRLRPWFQGHNARASSGVRGACGSAVSGTAHADAAAVGNLKSMVAGGEAKECSSNRS